MPAIKQFLRGSTFKTTWVSSGITPSAIISALYDGAETLVSSLTMTLSGSAGSGHYFALHTMPSSPADQAFYVNEIKATVDSRPYIARQYLEAVLKEAD